jgi:hypothetical protein
MSLELPKNILFSWASVELGCCTDGGKVVFYFLQSEEIYLFIYFLNYYLKKILFYSYVHTLFGSFLPPSPRPLPYPLTPSLVPLTPHYQAETILPLFLILLKREYKQL